MFFTCFSTLTDRQIWTSWCADWMITLLTDWQAHELTPSRTRQTEECSYSHKQWLTNTARQTIRISRPESCVTDRETDTHTLTYLTSPPVDHKVWQTIFFQEKHELSPLLEAPGVWSGWRVSVSIVCNIAVCVCVYVWLSARVWHTQEAASCAGPDKDPLTRQAVFTAAGWG